MPTTPNDTLEDARKLLELALADPEAEFRPGQSEAICALVDDSARVLVVQRTGWGKSMVYFIATKLLRSRGRGVTILISPLLALMRDQISSPAAHNLGLAAETVNSTNKDDWPRVRESLIAGEVDLLLISPERLGNEVFVETFLLPVAENVGLLVIDEAHCISDWGHDFRPDYRRIPRILRSLPSNIPVLATTATANNRVVEDVQLQLGGALHVERGALSRESLCLQNIRLPDPAQRLAWLSDHLGELPGSGIIYVLTKRDSERVAEWLTAEGHDVGAYHSDVPNDGRVVLEHKLKQNQIDALVATTALAMGFDKPDLGFVVHFQAPGSVVHYYQQVGRAGRQLDTAFGVLFGGAEDPDIIGYFIRRAFPAEEHVLGILSAIEASGEGMTKRELERALNFRGGEIAKALKLIAVENEPAVVYQQGADGRCRWQRTRFDWHRDEAGIARLTAQRWQEWQQVQDYLDAEGCLMQYLSNALDDPEAAECGRCASCRGEPVVSPDVLPETLERAQRFLSRSEFATKPRVQCPPGAFTRYGWSGNLPEQLRAQKGRCLSRWGDVGWGRVVMNGKHDGHFGDALVEAVSAMILERWRPTPPPSWVTCVPSIRHPELVPDFARRLAESLGLPFLSVVTKARETEPQKIMENAYHQARNLDGVFSVGAEDVLTEPVLLVDDVIDSAWTLTVIAALLRAAEVPAVYPVALASTGYQ